MDSTEADSPILRRPQSWQTEDMLGGAIALLGIALLAQTALAWLALAGLVTLLVTRGRLDWWPAVSLVLLLAILNSLKWPDSDLAEYFQVIDDVRQTELFALLAEEGPLVSIKQTEPLFRTGLWLLAKLSPSPRISFALVCGIAIYSSVLWLSRSVTVARRSERDVFPAVAAAAVAMLLGVTFSLTGHLVRQYVAGAIFFVGMFGWAFTSKRVWLLLPIASCAIHNSALLLLGVLLLTATLQRHPRLFVSLLLAWFLAVWTDRLPLLRDFVDASDFIKEDGQIGVLLPLLDLALLGAAAWIWCRARPEDRPDRRAVLRVTCFAVALGVLLFTISEIPLLYFRSYFYVEFLRAPAIAFIVCNLLRRLDGLRLPAAILALVLSATLFWLRSQSSEWTYTTAGSSWPDWIDVHSTVSRWRSIERTPL